MDEPSARPALFRDRHHAGSLLGAALASAELPRPVVLGIARGGVAVAAAVAECLQAPLDVTLVRKVGAPGHTEFAIGAVAEGGVRVLSERTLRRLGIGEREAEVLLEAAEAELADQAEMYAGFGAALDLRGLTAVVVDDGLATGHTARAAIRAVRRRDAANVVLAAPVAARDAVLSLRTEADAVVSLAEPEDLLAVGYWYEDFRPVSDSEVAELLIESRRGAFPRDGD